MDSFKKNTAEIILFSSNIYPCKIGGMEIYNYYLVKSLINSSIGKRIKIITDCKKLDIPKSKVLMPLDNLFFIKRYGLGTLSSIIRHSFFKTIKWEEVKTIYIPYTSNFSFNAIGILILNKLFKVQYIIHIHGGGLGPWKPFKLMNLFFKNAKTIIGVSHPIVTEYSQRSNRKIYYLPPLVPFEKSAYAKAELKKEKGFSHFNCTILFVGSLKPLKGPETLLKAFSLLGKDFIQNHKLGLVLVGDGPLMESLQEKYKMIESVVFVGKVPNEKINNYYGMSDIYVIPSWFEGTPISLLEAMFNGMVCLGSNVSGINHIIQNKRNGLLFEKDNFSELSTLLTSVILDIQLSNSLKLNSKRYYEENFNYKNHIDEIINFLSKE